MDGKRALIALIGIIGSIIILGIIHSLVFYTTPTKQTVDNFLSESGCNPQSAYGGSEHGCSYYLRRHSTTIFGQIYKAGFPFFVYNPFGYFNYQPSNDEFHTYVLVVTRDYGPLVYSPVNGNLIGEYGDLMAEMGCEVEPIKKSLLSLNLPRHEFEMETFRCLIDVQQQMIEEMKLKSVDTPPGTLEIFNPDDINCDSNVYNCASFSSQAEAQAVFIHCGAGDIHYLDGDDDGRACESLT